MNASPFATAPPLPQEPMGRVPTEQLVQALNSITDLSLQGAQSNPLPAPAAPEVPDARHAKRRRVTIGQSPLGQRSDTLSRAHSADTLETPVSRHSSVTNIYINSGELRDALSQPSHTSNAPSGIVAPPSSAGAAPQGWRQTTITLISSLATAIGAAGVTTVSCLCTGCGDGGGGGATDGTDHTASAMGAAAPFHF